MEYLGNQTSTRVTTDQTASSTLNQDLLQKVLVRPVQPSYVNPSPFPILPALGFKFVN